MARQHSITTTNHNVIRRWAEKRNARPARVRGTGRRGDAGIIRLDFPGYRGARRLEEISWKEWFNTFDRNNLALVYQNTTASGRPSNFNKLVERGTVARRAQRRSSRRATTRAKRGTTRTRATRGTTRSGTRTARAAVTKRRRTGAAARGTTRTRTTGRRTTTRRLTARRTATRRRVGVRASATARGTTARRRSTTRGGGRAATRSTARRSR